MGGATLEESRGALRLYSPVTHVTSDDPPLLTIHGAADTLVPLRQVQILHEAYKAANLDSHLLVIPGAVHSGPQFESEAMKALVRRFVAARLRG